MIILLPDRYPAAHSLLVLLLCADQCLQLESAFIHGGQGSLRMQLRKLGAGLTQHSMEVGLQQEQLLVQLLPPLLETLLLGFGLPTA